MSTAKVKEVNTKNPMAQKSQKSQGTRKPKPVNVTINQEGKNMEVELLKADSQDVPAANLKAMQMPDSGPNPSSGEMDESENVGKDLEQELVDAERKGFEDMAWYLDIPKKERLRIRDIVYNVDLDRFGIFVAPARKPNLARMRLLKVASKGEVYTRDWFVPYESLALVKRGEQVKRGFVETDREFVRRAGKITRGE